MKKLPFYFTLHYFVLSLVLLSCSNDDDELDCSTVDPGPNWFEMGFFNAEGNPLLGTEYTQESYRLFNAQEELFISPWATGSLDYLVVRYEEITNDRIYYIELSETDTDTLKFNFTIRQGPCFPNYILEQVTYNDEAYLIQNNLPLQLIKQ